MSDIQDAYYPRGHRVKNVSEMFSDMVKHIAITHWLDGRSPTGYFAYGYPDDQYGFDTIYALPEDEITLLIVEAEKRGFVLSNIRAEYDSPTQDTHLMYSIPRCTWWNGSDFPDWKALGYV